ncbi:MAG: hypothetical protein DMG98_15855 [Acidobacteria bacterium]|nr:MAG: hypothetical protein DMG98_15855 [Acidobacteriota bacterium]
MSTNIFNRWLPTLVAPDFGATEPALSEVEGVGILILTRTQAQNKKSKFPASRKGRGKVGATERFCLLESKSPASQPGQSQ